MREIAARTEQYPCPIKHARKVIGPHRRYARYADFADAGHYHAALATMRAEVASERMGEAWHRRRGYTGLRDADRAPTRRKFCNRCPSKMRLRLLPCSIHQRPGGVDRRYDLRRTVGTLAPYDPDVVLLPEVDDGVARARATIARWHFPATRLICRIEHSGVT